MYKLEVRVIIEDNNYYEKNLNTIQLMPENVDGSRHLTKNISAISFVIHLSWVSLTQEIR